jgi:myosin-1
VFNFSADEEFAILQIIAVILHLGQTGFLEDNGQAVIAKYQPIQSICRLLQCDEKHLKQAFTSKSIEVRGEFEGYLKDISTVNRA